MTGRPTVLGDKTEHYWLVQRMAKASGVNLVRAVEEGLLSQADWAGIVTRCQGCRRAGDCEHWLDAPIDDTRDVPSPCRNRNRFVDLLDRMQGETPKER